MKALLSHSSKDKYFVEAVANIVGISRCEYDAYTFEYILNAQAIRRAFSKSDLFVLFLSENSINSSFVSEEIQTALDFRAQGKIKKVIIITLDHTSFRALPEWMQSINVITRLNSPQTCARKIEAELVALDAEYNKVDEIYIPIEEEISKLRRVLSKPPGIAPVSIHAVGYPGVGRKTFLKKALADLYPRQIQTFVFINMGPYEGVNEFYRRMYDNFQISSIEEKISDFEIFASSSEDIQIEKLCEIFDKAIAGEEFIIVDDTGGVYTDDGEYQGFFKKIIASISGSGRPFIGFCQSRMMPQRFREEEKFSYHTFIPPLSNEKMSELVSFSLRDAEIDFSGAQLSAVSDLVEGYPINVRLAVRSIQSYGMDLFLEDPSLLTEWKRRRAEDFLGQIEFSKIETDIISLLVDFQYLSFSFIKDNIPCDLDDLGLSLRKLEDYCCIERRGVLYTIFRPIQAAAGRDKRFKKSNRWRGEIALKILQVVDSYKTDESLSISILETAAKATIISGKYSGIASSFILPSHFLSLARDAYADDKWKDSLDFCKKAFAVKSRLSQDGLIELLRLWGITSIRLIDDEEFDFAIKELEKNKTKKLARRNIFFLRGFRLRLKKEYDKAEKQFLEAYKIAPKNISINRELASLYRYRGEFADAEFYARNAYEVQPTNAFILDVLLEAVLGKQTQGLPIDQQEVAYLFGELKKYGDVPGSSFYQSRVAQELFAAKRKPEALTAANAAIARTPEFLPCYLLRADIYLSMGNVKGAKEDLKRINEILDKRGGFSEENEGRVIEIEIKILIEEKNYRGAKEKLYRSQFVPSKVRSKLARSIAKSVVFASGGVDEETQRWAKKYLE